MNKYFTSEIHTELKVKGYILAVYEVPHYAVICDFEGVQCAFNPTEAKRIQRKVYKDESTFQQLKVAA